MVAQRPTEERGSGSDSLTGAFSRSNNYHGNVFTQNLLRNGFLMIRNMRVRIICVGKHD